MDIAQSGCVDDAPHPFDPPDAMSPDALLDTEAWRAESPSVAVERLLRGMRAATRRVDDVEQEANRLRMNVAAWVDERTRSDRDRIGRYRGALQWIVGDYREATGTAKISTPSGSVTHRRGTAPKVEVIDESAVLRWVVDTLDPVVVERVARLELSRVDLRKALTVVPLGDDLTAVDPETGTVCPGVRVSAPTDDIAVSWPTTDDEEAGR